MLQIADGAMARTSDILTRMKTLTVQASSDQLGNTERGMLDTEYQALLSEIDRIASDTEFNGKSLVSGETALLGTTVFATATGFESVHVASGETYEFAFNAGTDELEDYAVDAAGDGVEGHGGSGND